MKVLWVSCTPVVQSGTQALGQVLFRKDAHADVPGLDTLGEGEDVGPSDGWGCV